MIYLLTSSFVRINESTGTVQNTGNCSVEISTQQVPGTGIILLRNEKISFTNLTLYARGEGSHGVLRVAPFVIAGGSSASSSGGSSSEEPSVDYNTSVNDMWNEPIQSGSDVYSEPVDDAWNANPSSGSTQSYDLDFDQELDNIFGF